MDRLDRRIQRTHKLLGDALISLILERGYEGITIKEVTQRADVAYATFFRHYKDIDELLSQRLDEITQDMIAHIHAEKLHGAAPVTEGTLVFRHAQAHCELYRVLLKSAGAFAVTYRLRQRIAAIIETQYAEQVPHPHNGMPLSVVSNHLAASTLALIEWWLDHDMPYPPERMGEIYKRLEQSARHLLISETSG